MASVGILWKGLTCFVNHTGAHGVGIQLFLAIKNSGFYTCNVASLMNNSCLAVNGSGSMGNGADKIYLDFKGGTGKAG